MVQVVAEIVTVGVVQAEIWLVSTVLVAIAVVVVEVVKMIQIALDRVAAMGVPESFGVLVDRTQIRIRRIYKYKNLTS